MSGHSKWSQIKRQKGTADAKRGQIFTKLAREIAVSVRHGGSDPEANIHLRLAIQKARDHNMPAENVERAIKKGLGETEAAALAEVTYEGFGPGGAAVLLQVLTDNRNRIVADIRNLFTRAGCSLGETGCVAWLFEPRGIITVHAGKVNAEELALLAIDAGADDVKVEDTTVEVYTQPDQLEQVRKALEEMRVPVETAELSMVPKTTTPLEEKDALSALKFLEKLEDLDDVQRVFTNADFPTAVVERYQSGA